MFKSIFCVFIITINLKAFTQTEKYNYSEENQIDQQVPDLTVSTADSKMLKLSSLYVKSPVIVAFVYTRCSGICSPFLLNLAENISEINPPRDFKVLVISFDSSDGTEDMKNLAAKYKLDNNKRWIFAVTNQIELFNKSFGFYPVWDSSRKQFDHEALLVGINQEGFMTKRLTGLPNIKEVASLIKEINGTFVVSYPLPGNNLKFSCFSYNPTTGERKLSLGFLLLITPFIISLLLVFIFSLKSVKRT